VILSRLSLIKITATTKHSGSLLILKRLLQHEEQIEDVTPTFIKFAGVLRLTMLSGLCHAI